MAKGGSPLARPYAKALLEVFVEMRGADAPTDRVQAQLMDVSKVLQGEAGVFFESPVFGRDEKMGVLDGILQKSKVEPEVDRFLRVLVSLSHTELLGEIALEFTKADRDRRKEVEAIVRTAFPLSTKDQERIGKALGRALQKNVLVEASVDKELIGGVIAEVGGVVFDASIRNYLKRMQEEL
jgi:F-type H+-transporting ATPase subunit delta